ncbi:zinc-binding dehydrogenase [Pseudonocardia humida]|uniref:Zinc-binding dehydrogenase n=1 Tax=Pseudonocardia humida TaxID=2800819 RepID=A0ABT0ZV76_9PSEU|nr:zinc-binding dehydrogenase [Pseudonocardia humida]MCO1654575.1 zinc-binding dehydrogenase [Pseudonocardia humida]
MLALVHDPTAPAALRRTELPDPVPAPGEALLAVSAASLNFLDVAYADAMYAVGAVPGVDAAGTVVTAAADGSGPPAGTRVSSFSMGGALATLRAVATDDLAVVPDGVEDAVAAALPAAGVTALRAVRRLGSVLGRRVLVTGAAGGVGRYAVQLAAAAGAHVVAQVGAPARAAGLRELGAADVIVSAVPADLAPVHGVIDNVGGPVLAAAVAVLAEDGVALAVGQASGLPTTIDFEAERRRGGRRAVEVFTVDTGHRGFGADIEDLLALVAAHRLDPQIGWRGSWERTAEAAEALRGRRVPGKAVVEISRAGG